VNPTYRPIPGFPGYRVGDDGTVWSCRKKHGVKPWRLLKPQLHTGGYMVACLRKERKQGKTYRVYVHRLVLETFVGPCPPGMVACHGNDDPWDNRLSNLRWDTQVSNYADSLRHGTAAVGEQNGQAKLKESDLEVIDYLRKRSFTFEAIARLYLVAESCIRSVFHRNSWSHLT
jgi:hypothetical protein